MPTGHDAKQQPVQMQLAHSYLWKVDACIHCINQQAMPKKKMIINHESNYVYTWNFGEIFNMELILSAIELNSLLGGAEIYSRNRFCLKYFNKNPKENESFRHVIWYLLF